MNTHPYYRRRLPEWQNEREFLNDFSLKHTIKRLRVKGTLPPSQIVSVKDIIQQFKPQPLDSMRSLLLKMLANLGEPPRIDLINAHMEPYGVLNPVAEANRLFDKRAAAAIRAAVGIDFSFKDSNGNFQKEFGPRIWPDIGWEEIPIGARHPRFPYAVERDSPSGGHHLGDLLFSIRDLLEMKWYGDAAPTIYIPRAKCLAAMAYLDYFPNTPWRGLRAMVSTAILESKPGWCGTFGPGVDAATDLLWDFPSGDYDMSQMHLLAIAYSYYDDLTPEAREHLIRGLLAGGTIHRPGLDDHFTSGGVPADWRRAGFVVPAGIERTIDETENHILMILTARYLTNQLLYQRDHDVTHDNRRNGTYVLNGIPIETGPHCTELVLTLLRRILRDDFSEYNAKPYQTFTRMALLNLYTYAYDDEVRLAARMVLDYISAHFAVSSNDLRRMVPFRRRNEGKYVTQNSGFMDVGLLDGSIGADPLAEHFAMQAGNTRAYKTPWRIRPWPWSIDSDGNDATMEVLSYYRLPRAIHDLFVNDLNRRFFQRLHRFPAPEEYKSGRNCDNMEIYAGSPSYLITAGGSPSTYAIDPRFLGVVVGDQDQQIGVAVTTSFMATGQSAGAYTQNTANDLIQFSSFSSTFSGWGLSPFAGVANYGVAPDFACGHTAHLPGWVVESTLMQAVRRLRELGKLPTTEIVSVKALNQRFQPSSPSSVRSTLYKMREIMANNLQLDGHFFFVNRGSSKDGVSERPGFYLAILQKGEFTVMEAFDTWLHPNVSFEQFKASVRANNRGVRLKSNIEAQYTTQNGNRLNFVIWNDRERELAKCGARILKINYGPGDPKDTLIEAGNDTARFLSGTIMSSPAEGVVEIRNPFLQAKITLDMSDPFHPKRTAETGGVKEVEEAGGNHEVWVDFSWEGPSEGDFFRPFNTISAAITAVVDGGVIKIVPGSTSERPFIQNNKRFKLVAPIGGVTIGAR
jgi:hypothetical protein